MGFQKAGGFGERAGGDPVIFSGIPSVSEGTLLRQVPLQPRRRTGLNSLILTIAFVVIALPGCKKSGGRAQDARATPFPTPFVITGTAHWKTVEEFDYAWKHSEAPMHFTLERPEGYDDPGDFIRIRIQVKDRSDFVLNNEDGWVEYNNQEEKSEVYGRLKEQNLVRSKYVLILPNGKGKNDSPLVLLRSRGYASDAERLHVIGFQPSGDPLTLLNTELDLEQLVDLDGDGFPEIVGWPCMSQGWGQDLLTYAPHHVYKVPHPVTSPARLSLDLSKTYI
jgi:hypothetical protein